MFNKLIRKLRLPQNEQKFQISNLNFRLAPRQFRLPTFEYTKFAELVGTRVSGLGYKSSKIATILRAQVKKYVNKKTITASIASCLAIYIAYEYNPVTTKIMLSYDENEFNNHLVPSLTYLHNKHFYPPLVCTTPLLQGIMNKAPPDAAVRYMREPVSLPDGGQIMLDWALPVKKVQYVGTPLYGRYYPYQPSDDNKIIFIIHGLTGGSETNYIQTIVEAARRKGYRAVVMNQRGVNQPLSTPFPFHGGHLDDLEAGLAAVKKKYPRAPIVAVGTSFGGNQLMRYLGQERPKVDLLGGVVLAAPFDIDDCVNQVQDTIYEDFFIRSYLEKNFLPNFDMFQVLKDSHGVNLEEIIKVRSLRDYHALFTVKLFEHKDVGEYFQTTKVQPSQINNVKVPLLILHAKDDPIAVHKSIPIEDLRKNPNIIFAETKRGGHLCWFTGIRPKRWYGKPTIEFLDKVLELKYNEKREI